MRKRIEEVLISAAVLLASLGGVTDAWADGLFDAPVNASGKVSPSEVVRLWRESAQGSDSTSTDTLLLVASSFEAIGQPEQGAALLEIAVSNPPARDPNESALLYLAAARARLYFGPPSLVERHLENAKAHAERSADDATQPLRLFLQASFVEGSQDHESAVEAFVAAAEAAEKRSDSSLAAQAWLNAARITLSLGQERRLVRERLARATKLISGTPGTASSPHLRLGAASIFAELNAAAPTGEASEMRRAFEFASAARVSALANGDGRTLAESHAILAKLYRSAGRREEANEFLERAIADAERIQARDLIHRFNWDLARAARKDSDFERSRRAYLASIAASEGARAAIANRFPSAGRSRFRQEVEPLFLEAVELLLGEEGLEVDEQRLRTARSVMEQLRAAELTDYFQDDCVEQLAPRTTDIDALAKSALIVYPIALEGRLELLVTSKEGLARFTVPVSRTDLASSARAFRNLIQEPLTRQYLRPSRQIHDWLVAPLESLAARVDAKTIVFVPDPAIRAIPMAALHDGERFLIERLAVAISPGLSLTDAEPMRLDEAGSLLAGVTVSRHGLPALPAAKDELIAIQEILGGQMLVDDDFAVERMTEILEDESNLGIVHISSHGVLKGNVGESFIAAFDKKLDMNMLTNIIGIARYREQPIDLLTLSACSTAAGDDRAALGMAGLAIKAGARSALASLWEVPDQTTSALMVEFYRNLKRGGVSKAQALRAAQLRALENAQSSHPSNWSAFILISNWL